MTSNSPRPSLLGWLFLLLLLPSSLLAQPTKSTVRVIEIADEVDLGMASYVAREVAEAEKENQSILLHINTFGGRLDAGVQIRDVILNAKVPMTIAFIDKRAISAGALIALSAKKIVMSDGATIGAATPIVESGEKASEKVVSYMRGEMRSTAERYGRNPKVAEAMVDEALTLDSSSGLVLASGKLLTMTTEEAKKVGYVDAEAETVASAIDAAGISGGVPVQTEESLGDKLLRLLTNSVVSGLLIMIGLSGLFFSIKSGHIGLITAISIFALVLFFGGRYITSIAPTLAAVLFVVGVGLLIAELFIPSFGIVGVLGITGIVVGLFLALVGDFNTLTPARLTEAVWTLAGALVGFVAIGALIIKYAPSSNMLSHLRNTTFSGDQQEANANRLKLIGLEGTAVTLLRPSGTAKIGETLLDVVTRGEYLPPGSKVRVVDVSGNRYVVMSEAHATEALASVQDDNEEPFGGRLPGKLDSRV